MGTQRWIIWILRVFSELISDFFIKEDGTNLLRDILKGDADFVYKIRPMETSKIQTSINKNFSFSEFLDVGIESCLKSSEPFIKPF